MAKSTVFGGTHLIFGGARSGKTAHAVSLALNSGLEKWMVATAGLEDEEMRDRIARHKEARGSNWSVIEERLQIVDVMEAFARPNRILVVDCLTLWLCNLSVGKYDLSGETLRLTEAVKKIGGPVIFVSNEIGLGLVPETDLGRFFRDAQGHLNQAMAQACDAVTFVAAGLPLVLKGRGAAKSGIFGPF